MEIVVLLLISIVVLYLVSLIPGSTWLRKVFKDEFKSRSEIGNQNIGKTKKKLEYREIAKNRKLEEVKNLQVPVNPKVTTSISNTSRVVKKSEVSEGENTNVRNARR